MGAGSKAKHPGKKLWTDHNIGPDSKMRIAVSYQEYIMSKSVKYSTDKMVLKPQLDIDLIP